MQNTLKFKACAAVNAWILIYSLLDSLNILTRKITNYSIQIRKLLIL